MLQKNHYFYRVYFVIPMNILLVAATAFEVGPLLTHLSLSQGDEKTLRHSRFDKLDIDVLITGIGMIHTAFHLGKALAVKRYDFAVNAGIAGAYNTSMELGKVVNVTRDCIAELGMDEGERFINLLEPGLMDPDVFPYRSGYLYSDKFPDLPSLSELPRLPGNTINQIHAGHESLAAMKVQYPAEVETMEGAAFLYGCLFEGIPCVQIRSFSNHVGERNKSLWQIPLAIENLNKTLLKILQELCT